MGKERYLLQRGSNRFFIWTAPLAKRKDMVEVDADTIQVRIKAVQDELEQAKALIYMKREGTMPDTMTKGAVALKNLNAELAAANEELQALRDGDEVDPLAEDKKINTEAEDERDRLMETVETDAEILAIRAMRAKKEVASYLASKYGVPVPENLDNEKLEDLKNQACIKRTGTIQELLDKE